MNIGGDYRKKNNSYIYMPPKYNHNPNIYKPPSNNPVILTYPSKEVYDKIK